MLQMFEEDPELVILTSDEAHFHFKGSVNKQNFHYWSTINPRQVHEHPLHCDRVTVWIAVAKFGVIGPYFFEENGRSVTANSARYIVMIRNSLITELRRRRLNQFRIWFQQDGATAHTSRETMAELRRLFPGKLISHRGDVLRPPCSPDLSPCDFFLWGYLKEKVYVDKPRDIPQLQNAIERESRAITRQMCEQMMANFSRSLNECVKNKGRHLNDVIFHV